MECPSEAVLFSTTADQADRYVLIIEADPERAEELIGLCGNMGLRAQGSPDPLHGLMKATGHRPAVVLVDAADEWLGTVSVAESFRRHPSLASIPFMIIGDSNSPSACSGCADSIVGDFDAPDFERNLRRALRRWVLRARSEARRQLLRRA